MSSNDSVGSFNRWAAFSVTSQSHEPGGFSVNLPQQFFFKWLNFRQGRPGFFIGKLLKLRPQLWAAAYYFPSPSGVYEKSSSSASSVARPDVSSRYCTENLSSQIMQALGPEHR
jgi:hypothetical protein